MAEHTERKAAALPSPASVKCPHCGKRTFHPKEIAEGYCGFCRRKHEPPPKQS